MQGYTYGDPPPAQGESVGSVPIERSSAPHPTRSARRPLRYRETFRCALAAALALLCVPAFAQSDAGWPNKPIHMIVPLPAGSAVDLVGRLVAQKLGARLGQTIVVDNRPGASGAIGTDALVRAAPDGYTLGMATTTTLATAPVLNPNLPYDPIKDVAPVALLGISPYVLVAYPGVPAENLQELIALAKAKPGSLSYSSVGEASLAHLGGLLLSSMAGIKLTHIPYKSSTHAAIDLVEGRIDLQLGILPTTLQLIRTGKLRVLAVTTDQRLDEVPDVPTFDESGLKGFEASLWFAVVAPKRIPSAIVARLNREIEAVIAEPDVKSAWTVQGIFPQGSSAEALGERIARDVAKWRSVATGLNAKDD